MTSSEKKVWLFGVFSACPLNNPLKGCPFEEYRKQTALKRWEYIDSLSDIEVNDYIQHHRECLYKREFEKQKFCMPYTKTKKTG